MSTLANSEDPDEMPHNVAFHQGLHCLPKIKTILGTEVQLYLKIQACDPQCKMNCPRHIVWNQLEKIISIQRVNRLNTVLTSCTCDCTALLITGMNSSLYEYALGANT